MPEFIGPPRMVRTNEDARAAFQEGDIVTLSWCPGEWLAHFDEGGGLSFIRKPDIKLDDLTFSKGNEA